MIPIQRTNLFEFPSDVLVDLAHLVHQCYAGQQDTVVSVVQERLGLFQEMVHEFWYSSDDTDRAESSLEIGDWKT